MRARILLYLVAGLLGVWSSGAFAKEAPSLSPTLDVFRQWCRKHRQGAADVHLAKPALGRTLYLPVLALNAAQSRFSFHRFLHAFDKIVKQEKLYEVKPEDGRWPLPHHRGRAVYPDNRKITGLYYRGRVYILDGHHRALISTYLGAETLPVEVIADWSHKPEAQFHQDMHDAGYSYHRNYRGQAMKPRDLCDLIDDPYLLLARKLMLRVDLELDRRGVPEILGTRGADTPILLKLNRDIPFLEFELADRLRRAGVIWEPGDELDAETLMDYLQILKKDQEQGRLKPVLLLTVPTDAKNLDLVNLIGKHLETHECAHQLMSSDND